MKQFSLVLVLCLLLCGSASHGQRIATPDGETVVSIATFTGAVQNRLAATRITLYSSHYTTAEGWTAAKPLFQTLPGVQISDIALKNGETGDTRTLAVLLNNGRIVILSYNAGQQIASTINTLPAAPATGGGGGGISWQKVVFSDVVYVRVSSQVYSRPISGDTWKQENTGIGNSGIQDIALDSQHRLFGGTNTRGLFQLLGDGTGWQRVMSYDTAASATGIFPLKNTLFYVCGNRGALVSTDQGTTWQRDTAGAGTTAFARLVELSDGTLFAASNPNQTTSALWRKAAGTTSWSRAENSLTAAAGQIIRISDMAGEQTVEIASAFGCFSSADKAANWTYSVSGVMSEEIYGYFHTPSHAFASTGVGIFRKANGGNWEKIYPQTGFVSGRPLYRTTAPEGLVTQLAAAFVGQGLRYGAILGSADNGATWMPDTTGLAAIPYSQQITPILHVDNQGSKFIGVSGSPVRTWASSGAWKIDTAGMDMVPISGTQVCSAISTDASVSNTYVAGGIYLGSNNPSLSNVFLFKKIRPDSAWVADTLGLDKTVLTAMTSDKNDVIYGGSAVSNGVSRIVRKVDSVWVHFPSPPTAISDVRAINVADDGSVFVAFSPVLSTGTPNRGVYVTADEGKTWDYAGLDSITVRGLTANGADMLGFTNRGVYKLTKQTLKNPEISLATKQIAFGMLEVGKTKDTTVEIANTGNDTLRVTNIASTLAEFSVTPRQVNVAPGGKQLLTVRFAPTTAGAKTATLRTVSNTFPDSINVSGEGVAASTVKMTVSVRILRFDTVSVGATKDMYFTVKNDGTDTLRVLSTTSSNNAFTINPQTFNLGGSDTQSVRVRFRPSAVGDRFGEIRILTNANNDTLRFEGTGAAPASAGDDISLKLGMSVSPNPAGERSTLSMTLPRAQRVSVELVDAALGRTIAHVFEGFLPEGAQKLPVEIPQSGAYLLRVTTHDGTGILPVISVR